MKVAVVIPCFKVKEKIISVLSEIGPTVSDIIVIDDKCPQESGNFVKFNCKDPRVQVIFHEKNKGVGGAVITGYKRALELGADIVVKLDGDGQMDPRFIDVLISPIIKWQADYCKGNRFYDINSLEQMPIVRIIGNAGLSFISKISSGYYSIMDPTNGFTAIHKSSLQMLPLNKISNGYFFESDMLFRLNSIRAVVRDVPMNSKYEDENSNLNIFKSLFSFAYKHFVCLFKRTVYNYFLRNFSIASLEFVFGFVLFFSGVVFGLYKWSIAIESHTATPTGTIMISTLSIIIGFQLLISAITFDMSNTPNQPISTFGNLTMLNTNNEQK